MKKMTLSEQMSTNGGSTHPWLHEAVVWYGERLKEIPATYAVTTLYLRSKI